MRTPQATESLCELVRNCRYSVSVYENVCLVVPLYNEATVIGDVVTNARRTFANVICVDDGSKDNSAAIAEAAGAKVIRHPVNLGQGAALQTGFEYALTLPSIQYVVTFDSDGQHQIADVLVMLDRIQRDNLDVVFGSRFLDKRTKPSPLKTLILRLAVLYTNLTTKLQLSDAHNGLRVLSRDVVSRLHLKLNRMAHASEIVEQIGKMRIDGRPVRYAEEPVHILYTDYAKAKGQSLWNSVNILVELILR